MKAKIYLIVVILMAALGAVLWCLWSFAIRSYYTVITWFGLYGYVCIGINLAKWMTKEPPDPATFQDRYMDER